MADEFEGYTVNDITYCVDPATDKFFPVRIVKIGRKFADVESINPQLTNDVTVDFETDKKNRRFLRPQLPRHARFGGCEERIVNTERNSGQELRLLPFHYGTYTGGKIKELHKDYPELWPLPTGLVYERWFKDSDG
ncbi:hypothetical protein M4951_10290 [Blastopirellula sp. J2-11]|uniref:hypothetical protein n=1 Tax=Blastopirellula sp. J2-11 TaxID=2943192 RepID=UPI0021C57ED5|nr:hypothetical protein [Blastopirellula sp. J2-11]UUO08687.1 hypothetical protein M4951_10290 [Blastopirellula sp. J2-11]